MRRLDELYLRCPFFGSRKMAFELGVNRKRIQRLMRMLGIEAIYPKPNLSRPAPGHEVYPYLLRNLPIERPNHVWAMDITYLPMKRGFVYGDFQGRCRVNHSRSLAFLSAIDVTLRVEPHGFGQRPVPDLA